MLKTSFFLHTQANQQAFDMSDPNKYTVGWICAVTEEMVAAQAFLDEHHSDIEYQAEDDDNTYTLGKIGKHNVVITSLPHSNVGIARAATTAKDLLRTFPNIKIGLMVGIAGGVPTYHDIRLGDIVVSSLDSQKGAVLQYNFGRSVQGQGFQPTGHQNGPALLLQGAVTALKAKYELEGHSIEESIASALERRPRLRKRYRRPEPTTDRLYKSTVPHRASASEHCLAVCGLGDSLISREARADDEDNPKIHEGLIASADEVMKDATKRDSIAKESDVLCFETEAAGVMNHFKCLIIRGICNYSDSHRNSDWQGYAAMTAAAYAKDVLGVIAPSKIKAAERLRDTVQDS